MVPSPFQCYWRGEGRDSSIVSVTLLVFCSYLTAALSVAITGLVVLGGHTRVEDPHANFRNAFEGTSSNGNGLATALVKVNFAYAGFEVCAPYYFMLDRPMLTVLRMPSMS